MIQKDRVLLPDGYSDVAMGKIATVVTCLEMHERPAARPDPSDAPWKLRRVRDPDVVWYRGLFRRVGEEWLWYSRLVMPLPALSAILASPDNEVYALDAAGIDEGLLELDFRAPGQCELAFFGLTRAVRGRGAGRWLMNRALERAWSRSIGRLWVHTCTLDHPDALGFYLRSGFSPYARRIEVADDPRLSGLAESTAAPHVPVIRSSR